MTDQTPARDYFDWHGKPPFWRDYTELFDSKAKILDIGCGEGWLGDHFEHYTGIDSSQEAVSRGLAKNRNVQLASAEGSLPFPDQSFDAVLLKDVLEHLLAPAATVRECHRVLRDGGRVAAFSPSPQKWVWDDYTHVRPFSRKGFRKLFEDQGFTVEKASYEPIMPGTGLITKWLHLERRPRIFWPLCWLPGMRRNVMVLATKQH